MIFKSFRFGIFLRITIIVVLALLFAFVLLGQQMLFAPLVIFLLLIAMVVNLIQYIEKLNRDFTHLLLSIRQGAFTETYTSGNRGTRYEELSVALNEVVTEFANLNEEKELHYQYLQALNENISVAILSFDADGKLLMMNAAAKRLLNFPAFAKAEHFRQIDQTLYETVENIKPEERTVVKVIIKDQQFQLNIQAKEIILQDKLVRIILLQNLNQELEAKEIEAWHQLVSVLTHEIMNSVTPIVSLTAAVQNILTNGDDSPKDLRNLSDENIEDIFSSLSTISTRSKGLLKFVNAYKEYSKPLELRLEVTDVLAMITRILDLLAPDLQKSGIQVKVNKPPKAVTAKTDVALMEQVFINLIKNAMEAVPDNGTGSIAIEIKSRSNNQVAVSVSDNGSGIDAETLPRIFVPFFTTKIKGTGIGLSLSRQILKLHNGTISAQSGLGKGSTFTITW